jgi:transcriptional regulator with XRE-family HTH domain
MTPGSKMTLGYFGQILATRVRTVRTGALMTQHDLAKLVTAAGCPLTAASIAEIEKGRRRVTVDELVALRRVLRHVLVALPGEFV